MNNCMHKYTPAPYKSLEHLDAELFTAWDDIILTGFHRSEDVHENADHELQKHEGWPKKIHVRM